MLSPMNVWWNNIDYKLHDGAPKNNNINQNLNLLCDLDLFLGLHVSYVYILIKFAQFHNMFVILSM
jgi:hypothetical protein